MRVLALDTATRDGSVAILEDGRVLIERPGDGERSHAERLPRELLAALGTVGLTVSAIDIFAVAAGPGSFTGLRIGIAAMQGLAFVTGRRMVPISVLAAMADVGTAGLAPGKLAGVWMDAHRGEIFSALYRVPPASLGDAEGLLEVESAGVGTPDETLTRWSDAGLLPGRIIGDGAVRYGSTIANRAEAVPVSSLAAAVGRLASACARAGRTMDPSAVQPLYVRRPDVVVARKKAPAR